jgi:hypothetical protein
MGLYNRKRKCQFSENFILGNKIGFIKKLFFILCHVWFKNNTLVRSFKPGGVPPDSEGALRG